MEEWDEFIRCQIKTHPSSTRLNWRSIRPTDSLLTRLSLLIDGDPISSINQFIFPKCWLRLYKTETETETEAATATETETGIAKIFTIHFLNIHFRFRWSYPSISLIRIDQFKINVRFVSLKDSSRCFEGFFDISRLKCPSPINRNFPKSINQSRFNWATGQNA